MNRPVHFEIQAEDTARAATFYKNVFGWEFTKWGEQEYWTIKTHSASSGQAEGDQPGINGGLMKRVGAAPVDGASVNAFVLTMDITDIDETLRMVKEFGGKKVVELMPVPGIGWLAYCKDTEGNIFGLMQNDPNAK